MEQRQDQGRHGQAPYPEKRRHNGEREGSGLAIGGASVTPCSIPSAEGEQVQA